jgi:hypothetical protein
MSPGGALIVQGPEEALFRYLTPISEKFEVTAREKIDLRDIPACHCDIEQSRESGTGCSSASQSKPSMRRATAQPDEEFVAASRGRCCHKMVARYEADGICTNSS